jgi:hypothetical protein
MLMPLKYSHTQKAAKVQPAQTAGRELRSRGKEIAGIGVGEVAYALHLGWIAFVDGKGG